ALGHGTTVAGMRYGPIDARLDSRKGTNAWLSVSLREGKNREVRRVLNALGLEVTRLIRVGFGPIRLGSLAPGEVEEVPRKVLREQVRAE
ncbi:MAG: pseudouridine synthase, partial [Acetobacteraceae bacterium]